MNVLKVGLAGLGTVGQGVFELLKDNAVSIERRLGTALEVTHVASRRVRTECPLGDTLFSLDVMALASDPNVDVVVELLGGTDQALELVMAAIKAGKAVVTANKALIAEHGSDILALAAQQQVPVLFEAAVAGGIPIVKTLKEGLAANHIQRLSGIINGTSNFIVTEMRAGREFAEVLEQAQALGYAEADPSFDVNGTDAAHKLAILSAIAFGIPLSFAQVYMEGITELQPIDFACADLLGYRIKHLGIAACTERGVSLRVHPTLIAEHDLLAHVEGVMNAVAVNGDAVGPSLSYGPGAGRLPTASAVVADLMDLARTHGHWGLLGCPLGFQSADESLSIMPIEDIEVGYYLRVTAENRSGVLADIAQQFSMLGINIESIVQRLEWADDTGVPIVIVTQPTVERVMNQAIAGIEQMVGQQVMRIRIASQAI